MDQFAAVVRIGDSEEHRTEEQALSILRLHVDEGCWSSPPGHKISAGMPVIASHIGAGIGWFLVGVFTGEQMPIPWRRRPKHANHVGHAASFMDAAFVADPDQIPGAKGRHLRWLSTDEFAEAFAELRVDEQHTPLARRE
jgi:hypothetical protein